MNGNVVMNVRKRKYPVQELQELSKEELIAIIKRQEAKIQSLKNASSKPPGSSHEKRATRRVFDMSKSRFRYIALKFLYVGWHAKGYSHQEDTNDTIEFCLFKALKQCNLIVDRSESKYSRCGRTDIGVSAFSQVISLRVRTRLQSDHDSDDDELPYCRMLNATMPAHIRVLAWSPVSDDFSARFSCKGRTYKYWFPRGDLDVQKMNEAIQTIIGTHDFRNLCEMDVENGVVNYVRQVFNAKVIEISDKSNAVCPDSAETSGYDICELTIFANAFLRHQIRMIITVLFLVGQNKENVDIFQQLLDIEKCPRKPQFSASSPFSLNLFETAYDNIPWRFDKDMDKTICILESRWTENTIKSIMVKKMIDGSKEMSGIGTSTKLQYDVLFGEKIARVYKPLLSRSTSASLEDQIKRCIRKGRLQLLSNDLKKDNNESIQ